jgi:DNA-binding transcriptional MerR regulator
MGRNGLLIGEVAARSGTTRKSLRRYEAVGILPAPRRTAAGYRVYDDESLALLAFIASARRLGFTLDEIRQIVAIKRSGRAPCVHVRGLVGRKMAELDRARARLTALRHGLLDVLKRARTPRRGKAVVCGCIESANTLAGEGGEAKWKR